MKNLILLLTHNSLYLHSSAGSDYWFNSWKLGCIWILDKYFQGVFSTYFPLNEDNCTETRQRGSSGTGLPMSGALHASSEKRRAKAKKKRKRVEIFGGAHCLNCWIARLVMMAYTFKITVLIWIASFLKLKQVLEIRAYRLQISWSMDQTRCTHGSNEEWTFQKRN